jgi:hypothetical protein
VQRDGAAGRLQAHLGQTGPAEIAADVDVEPVGEPHREQFDARVGLLARHLDGDDLE